jgi:arginase
MKIDIIGVPLGLGAGTQGPELGPRALRAAGLVPALRALAHEVTDRGDLQAPRFGDAPAGDPTRKYIQPILEVTSRLFAETAAAVARGSLPLILGGDHSVALGSVRGAARGRRLGVVWLDAHPDFNTPETSPSGNVHGMPLSALVGLGDPRLVHLCGTSERAVDPRHVALLGVRSIDPGERELLEGAGVTVITMDDIARMGMREATRRAIHVASCDTDGIYLSIDVDALDPSRAPGVTTPVPGGLSGEDARLACALIHDSRRLVGMDIVELNPIGDTAGQTARIALELACMATVGACVQVGLSPALK